MTESAPADLRGVPLYVLRTWYTDQVELSAIRTLATVVGIGKSTMQKFVSGETIPHGGVRRLLALYYLNQQDEGREQRNARAGLQILSGYLPEQARARFTMQLLDAMEAAFGECGAIPPEWIGRLRAEG